MFQAKITGIQTLWSDANYLGQKQEQMYVYSQDG